MRILVVGGSGMLGSDLVEQLRKGHEVVAPPSKEFDITDPASVAHLPARAFGEFDWVVNSAAYTAVDKAETEVREATELNAIAPGYLAKAAASAGAKLIHVSTDFVFDGEAQEPYSEDAEPHPIGVYGRTKLAGEVAVMESHPSAIVVRTSWLFGPNGNSFPKTMIRAWEAGKTLRVVADQTGCPTYTGHLASSILALLEGNAFPGIYHAAGPDAMTWHQFAVKTLECWKALTGSERTIEIEPIATEDWPTPARRPKYSVLASTKIPAVMPPTEVGVRAFCERLL